jgi:hypothetical protein
VEISPLLLQINVNALKLHLNLLNFQNQKKFPQKLKLRGSLESFGGGLIPHTPSGGNPGIISSFQNILDDL